MTYLALVSVISMIALNGPHQLPQARSSSALLDSWAQISTLLLLSKKDSSVVRMMSNWAWAILFMTGKCFWVQFPLVLSFVWSGIRLMVGIKMMVTFLVTMQGKWKHRLLPEPVGCTTRVFLPPRVALMICSCQSLKDVFLKTFTSNPISCVSWCPAMSCSTTLHDTV